MIKKVTLLKRAGFVLMISSFTLMACNNDASTNQETTSDSASGDHVSTGSDTATKSNEHAVAVLGATFSDTTVSGTALFDQNGSKVQLRLELNIPSKAGKTVAVHIHENGDCGDTAKKAGPHWNPTAMQHGEWEKGSFHAGDIGNVELDAQGKGQKIIESEMWTIGGDAKTNILNRTVVVHGGTDDYKSQPAGNSGARIGCGIIKQGGD